MNVQFTLDDTCDWHVYKGINGLKSEISKNKKEGKDQDSLGQPICN